MKPCKQAKESLKETGFTILTTSAIWQWVENDLSIRSIANTAWDLTKYTVKNDKKVQKNIGTFISCSLGLN